MCIWMNESTISHTLQSRLPSHKHFPMTVDTYWEKKNAVCVTVICVVDSSRHFWHKSSECLYLFSKMFIKTENDCALLLLFDLPPCHSGRAGWVSQGDSSLSGYPSLLPLFIQVSLWSVEVPFCLSQKSPCLAQAPLWCHPSGQNWTTCKEEVPFLDLPL